ncbi:hypothetical protein [Polyangium jinanense]|uniref:hypothetical protein n=1 Tax=Polyangium jinanense TaxID=2829994 RepID=UPI002340CB63|nr:hypothetical protein [Polyangium jinanense]
MPTDAVRCRVDVLVVDGKLEEALRELRKCSGDTLRELRKRRRDGPKPSEKRRNKRYFVNRFSGWRWRLARAEDELERARRDQEMFTRRAALSAMSASSNRRRTRA